MSRARGKICISNLALLLKSKRATTYCSIRLIYLFLKWTKNLKLYYYITFSLSSAIGHLANAKECRVLKDNIGDLQLERMEKCIKREGEGERGEMGSVDRQRER